MKTINNKKRCYKCKKILSIGSFSKDASRKDGLNNKCKECDKKWQDEYDKTPDRRFSVYKRDSKKGKRNYEFSLTKKQFMSFWGKKCYYCGERINGVGIDRVDNNIGYEIDNCVPCCGKCNRMKMSMICSEFIDKCKKIANNHFSSPQI